MTRPELVKNNKRLFLIPKTFAIPVPENLTAKLTRNKTSFDANK